MSPDQNNNQTLYKYRGFSNFEYAIDIILNQRLFAADFRTLNDPMEGRFRYNKSFMDRGMVRSMIIEKGEYGILSLSGTPDNHLLWSYYAEGHSGFAIGVKVKPGQDVILKPVEYVDDFSLQGGNEGATDVLCRKHMTWAHEQEFRVLKRVYNGPFVEVEITDLIFGKNANSNNKSKKDILETLAQKLYPNINIRTIDTYQIKEWIED
jgi:hypothetical protein